MEPKNLFAGIKGKRVLITGASGGIGSEIAKLFAEYGAKVGIHYNSNREAALKVKEDIVNTGGEAEIIKGDLLDHNVRLNLVDEFVKIYGGIDILINGAGAVHKQVHFSEIDEETWDKTFDLNLKSAFYLSGKAFEYMKKQKWGRIINLTSINVKFGGSAKSMHYVTTKAGLDNITIGFAREGAQHNILVNGIRCGVIDTDMHKKIKGYKAEDFVKRQEFIPLKKLGKPIDIARTALFLASECGDFITKEIITVAGGE